MEGRERRRSQSDGGARVETLEELASLSFGSEAEAEERRWWLEPSASHWTKGVEWETRIPPIQDEAGRERLVADFHQGRAALVGLVASLREANAEVIELEELLGRAGEASLEGQRIRHALEERYLANPAFLRQVWDYEELHGRLSTVRARVLDWEARRDADLLHGSLSSLDLDMDDGVDSHSQASADLSHDLSQDAFFEPSLPALPALLTRPSPTLARRKPQALNPDAADFVPSVRMGSPASSASSTPPPPSLPPVPLTPVSSAATVSALLVRQYQAAAKAASLLSAGKRQSTPLLPYTLTPFPLGAFALAQGFTPSPPQAQPFLTSSPALLPQSARPNRARKRLAMRHL